MKRLLSCLIIGFGIMPASVEAGMNVPVASRVVGFTQPAPAGVVNVAIIFQPGNPASEAEAQAIEQEIGAGLTVGRGSLRAHRVAANALGGIGEARIAFVTTGVRDQSQLAEAASRSSILTITSDGDCVRAGHCVVGVIGSTQPQIIVSRAAAKAANIRFGSAFLMLVKEL